MTDQANDRRYDIATCGFWLPCDQTAFFYHERDRDYRTPHALESIAQNSPENRLGDSIYHRLVVVLGNKGYTLAVPVQHLSRPYGKDPDAGVFLHPNFTEQDFSSKVQKDQPIAVTLPEGVHIHGLALLVNSSGFYLLLARYSMPAANKSKTIGHAVEEYLRSYIYDIFGGDFASRYSGWPDDKELVTDDYEANLSLMNYRDEFMGILTFNQINVIFEGLFSSSLDFQVFFFGSVAHLKDNVLAKKRDYSLGNFANLITTSISHRIYKDVEEESDDVDDTEDHWENAELPQTQPSALDFVRQMIELFPAGSGSPPKRLTLRTKSRRLSNSYLGPDSCAVLLQKFLQATAAEILQIYKQRIERCRWALLGENDSGYPPAATAIAG